MPLQMGALREALLSANAEPQKTEGAAEEGAVYENRFGGLERRLDVFEERVNSRFNALEERMSAGFRLQSWMTGFAIAFELILLGFVLRLPGH
jgi:hypothetical protein